MKNTWHRYVRDLACSLLVFFLYSPSFSQTVNIDSVVNRYYQVIEVIPSKDAVRVSSTSGIIPSYHAMIIQMKGATIDLTNGSTYGNITSLNEAGNYEINTICAVRGDTVFMVHDLLNTYTVSGKVQLVQFAEYVSANVNDTLKATPWNNTTGTGGVIALFVEDTLTLNAPIYADAAGFAGGTFKQSTNTCSNGLTAYIYNPTSATQNGAYKGEGIADLTTTSSGGRGAPANGGGGGNNHNNSGGGGSNLNDGGRGGGNSSTTSCNASANHKGEGGKALNSMSGAKIYLGGGGGAGQNNNGVYNFGGANGGGIIFIHAGRLIGNDTISANGGIGGMSQADGAGGGGGGGTIIMDVNNYEGGLKIKAVGGIGGTSDDALNLNICYGGGGGGSGGAIYFTGSIPPVAITVDSGLAGPEIRRHDASCATIQPASPGRKGQTFSGYTYRSSSTLANYCALVLPVGLTYFKATAVEKKVRLEWKIANPTDAKSFVIERMNDSGTWIEIVSAFANDFKREYNTMDLHPLQGYNLYRIKLIEKNNTFTYSSVQRIFIEANNAAFTFSPNPAKNKIIITNNLNSPVDMRLSDVSGKTLLSKKIISKQTEIDVSMLVNGVYFIRIDQTVRKLVIQK